MIVLYNPLSTTPGKQPLPLSLLALAAVLEADWPESRLLPRSSQAVPWTLVDGNVVPDPAGAIVGRLQRALASDLRLLAVTVMPGPQLTQAVAVCRAVRDALPNVPTVWGGYFPTQHADTVLRSSFVDFVVRSQGERPLVELLESLQGRRAVEAVSSLSWKTGTGDIVHNPNGGAISPDDLPDYPYSRVAMEDYIHPTYLGRRTVAHNSSFGCPFACSFCTVVSMSNRRWLAQTPARLARVVDHLVTQYRVDAVQMHDMDFFISEARVAEVADRIAPHGISWWGWAGSIPSCSTRMPRGGRWRDRGFEWCFRAPSPRRMPRWPG